MITNPRMRKIQNKLRWYTRSRSTLIGHHHMLTVCRFQRMAPSRLKELLKVSIFLHLEIWVLNQQKWTKFSLSIRETTQMLPWVNSHHMVPQLCNLISSIIMHISLLIIKSTRYSKFICRIHNRLKNYYWVKAPLQIQLLWIYHLGNPPNAQWEKMVLSWAMPPIQIRV